MIPLIEQQRETEAGLSLAAICRVLEVSRAAYYRARQPPAGDNETALRDAIQRIAVEMPAYGSRRITAELRRQGWVINRKRVVNRLDLLLHRQSLIGCPSARSRPSALFGTVGWPDHPRRGARFAVVLV